MLIVTINLPWLVNLKCKITLKKFNSMPPKKCNLASIKNEEIKTAFKEKYNLNTGDKQRSLAKLGKANEWNITSSR